MRVTLQTLGQGLASTGWAIVVAGVVGLTWAGECRAQGGAPPFADTYRRPSVSPMTMLGTGVGAGVGGNALVYQQLVQPRSQQEGQIISQMQQGRAINTLRGEVRQAEQRVTARFDQTIRPTGHAATYMNYSHFYRQ